MIAWFARNGVAANLLALLLAVGGILVAFGIKLELFPQFNLETVVISVPYPGAAPEDVEEGILLRIEEEVQDLQGIDEISSTASEGFGVVTLDVARNFDPQEVLDKVKVRIDSIDNFPVEAEEPIVELPEIERDTITVAIFGDLSERTRKALAEEVRDEVTLLPEISSAKVSGVRSFEVTIELEESQLRKYGLTFPQVAALLRSSSVDLPGGNIRADQGQVLLRANTLAKDREALGRIVLLSQPNGAIVRLEDVATIRDGFTTDPLVTLFEGQPAAMVRVYEVGDQNPLTISKEIREYVEEKRLTLPEGVNIEVWRDFSVYLRDRLNLLINNGLIGFGLVLLVLALFLRPLLALFVSIGIPISFLATLFVLPALGVTINLVTLFGFILVLGIVVDDAIVVGESVFTEFQERGPGVESSIRGTQRVSVPVTFAILTTVAAFAPILFVPGTFGKLFIGIPMIVIPTLLFSLVQAKLILPYHLSLVRVGQRDRDRIRGLRRLQLGIADALERFIDRFYRPAVAGAIRNRYLTLALFVATLFLTAGLVGSGWVRSIFLAPVPSDYVVTVLNMPVGSPYHQTVSNMEKLKAALDRVRADLAEEGVRDPVRHLSYTLGGSQFQGGGPGGSAGSESNLSQGEIALELVNPDIREISAPDLADLWREEAGKLPGVQDLTFSAEAANPAGTAINIRLVGQDFDRLEEAGDLLKQKLRTYEGIFDVRDSFSGGKDEINLRLRPDARAGGLTQTELARQVRGAFFGSEVQRVQRGRDEIRVMVRYPAEDRGRVETLEEMYIRTDTGEPIPLTSVAELERGEGFSSIRRVDRRRTVSVFADADDSTANVNDVVADLRVNFLPELREEFPNLQISFEGEAQEQREIQGAVYRGALLAGLVIYALLAIPFRSYLQPFIVMATIPFGLVGAIGGHWITGQDFSILSFLGLVALSGVVVNDSLVLVDYINQEMRRGRPLFEAIRDSGARRFRPVILTSLTTFVGLVPILLEKNLQAQFLIPMATSLAFGILFATFMTLFLVPALYRILEDLRRLVGLHPIGAAAMEAEAAAAERSPAEATATDAGDDDGQAPDKP
jgi:multidrug efflux pump subunit AcrB